MGRVLIQIVSKCMPQCFVISDLSEHISSVKMQLHNEAAAHAHAAMIWILPAEQRTEGFLQTAECDSQEHDVFSRMLSLAKALLRYSASLAFWL